MVLALSRLSAISQASGGVNTVNEDASYFCGNRDGLYILVVDGAAVRVRTAVIDRLVTFSGGDGTAASYVAQLACDTIAAEISKATERRIKPSLAALLLAANRALHAQLEAALGEVTHNAMLKQEPHLTFLQEDPRLLRLVLPACVASIAYADFTTSTLQFAHAGDTAVFVKYNDGTIVQITSDNMEAHDRQALSLARSKQKRAQGLHLRDFIDDDEVLANNRLNGLYHNFVDEEGRIDASRGVGVIDGLPELAQYIQQGTLELGDVRGLLACTDGFALPAPWDETAEGRSERLDRMWERIARESMKRYVEDLRKVESSDQYLDNYPRFKLHDDATAIFVEFSHE